MSSNEEPVKILAPQSFRRKLSRRALFQMGGAAAGLAIVAAACGDNKVASNATSRRHERRHRAAPTRHGGDGGTGDAGDSGTGLGVATGDYSRVTNKSSGSSEHVHVGRVQRPRHRRFARREGPRHQDAGQLLHQQRRPHHQARRPRRAPAGSTSSCPPARTSRR